MFRVSFRFVLVLAAVVIIALLAIRMTRGRPPAVEPVNSTQAAGSDLMDGGVRISPARLQTLGVRVDTLQYRKLDKVIRTVGRVDYDERRLTTVSTKVSGWVEKLYVDYTGKVVTKGEPLYEIYSPEVVSAEQEYLLALDGGALGETSTRWSDDIKTLLESAKRRLEFWDVPREHVRDLERTHNISKTMMIHSPASGFVLERNILEGGYVKPGHELFTIADISNVWVYADIYEYELPLIKEGQHAELSLSYFPGESTAGRVAYIYPYLEEKTRTIKVRFEFPNTDWKLKPGMFANVKIRAPISERALALPEDAVLDTGERQLVFVNRTEGVFEPRDVRLGLKANGYYEVLDGVLEGEVVAVSANFLIDSESRLGSATMKMKM